ncbi:MAG: hypothetical protein ACYS8Y_05585 [Planctomycetota bacterium]|jgi:hypothetical protein
MRSKEMSLTLLGALAWLKDIREIEPLRIGKKDWRAWVVLTEKESFRLLKKTAQKANKQSR